MFFLAKFVVAHKVESSTYCLSVQNYYFKNTTNSYLLEYIGAYFVVGRSKP